jgi:hypothetical protein
VDSWKPSSNCIVDSWKPLSNCIEDSWNHSVTAKWIVEAIQ